jgi:hypothetical protein
MPADQHRSQRLHHSPLPWNLDGLSIDASRAKHDENTLESCSTCVVCKRHSSKPDLDGWHIFSDGADEQYALCNECARARARRHVARVLFVHSTS